jgi:hypothetical protein
VKQYSKDLKMENMTKEEFTASVVSMFEMTTKERLLKKLETVLRSGCIDTSEELNIPTAKAFLSAFYDSESDLFTVPHGCSDSIKRKFNKQRKNMRYYI